MSRQRTLARAFVREGIGLRGGAPARLRAVPAPAGTGRVFIVHGTRIPATHEHVVDTTLATTLGVNGTRISLVEHLCAALHAAGVDNVELHVDGDELPVLDGSAKGWVDAIAEAGTVELDAPRATVRVTDVVRVEAGSSWVELHPAEGLHLELHVDFPHPAIGHQTWSGPALGDTFRDELAWARTFGFLRDAEALKAVARGVSLENTVVYDDADGVLNPEGLRADDEVVRHKALDTVGDLALLGADLHARLIARRPGHTLHVALLRQLRALGMG